MNTLLLINSNIDNRNDYTKTRIADQSGNFIVHAGDMKKSSSEILPQTITETSDADEIYPVTLTESPVDLPEHFGTMYSNESKFGNTSLHFNGNHHCYMQDRFHVFNFANRSFSIEAWVKFDRTGRNKVHTIMSKWTNDIWSFENRIFRFLYRHDENNPATSDLVFEFNGMKGYPNENFKSIYVEGFIGGYYDGEYISVPPFFPGFKCWKGKKAVLLASEYSDPKEWSGNESDLSGRGNIILNSDFMSAWHSTLENSDWKTPFMGDVHIPPTATETSSDEPDVEDFGVIPKLNVGNESSFVNTMAFSLKKNVTYKLTFMCEKFDDDRDISIKIIKNPSFQYDDSDIISNFSYDEVSAELELVDGVNEYDFVCPDNENYTLEIVSDSSYEGITPAQISSLSLRYAKSEFKESVRSYGRIRLIRLDDHFSHEQVELSEKHNIPTTATETLNAEPTELPTEPASTPTETSDETSEASTDIVNELVYQKLLDFDHVYDVTDYVYTGTRLVRKCGNLADGNWHHVYVSIDGDEVNEGTNNSDVCVFRSGVDGEYKQREVLTEEFNEITYSNFQQPRGTADIVRVDALSSIQPYFQYHNKQLYPKILKAQRVLVGAEDNVSNSHNLFGYIDSIRVNEFSTYENAQELRDYYNSNSPFSVVRYITAMENISKYDENTEYEFDYGEEAVGTEIFPVTYPLEDGEIPTTALEVYKQMIGSVEYLKSIWKHDTPPTDEDLQKWRWELKFVAPPPFLNQSPRQIRTYNAMLKEKLKTWIPSDVQFPPETITTTVGWDG
jgi:hypothetical protein